MSKRAMIIAFLAVDVGVIAAILLYGYQAGWFSAKQPPAQVLYSPVPPKKVTPPAPGLEEALAQLEGQPQTDFLVSLTQSKSLTTREWAYHKLAGFGSQEVWLRALNEENIDICSLGIDKLGKPGASDAIRPLIWTMRRVDRRGLEAENALVKIGGRETVSAVWVALVRSQLGKGDGSVFVRHCANVLKRITGDDPSVNPKQWLAWAERHEKLLAPEAIPYVERERAIETAVAENRFGIPKSASPTVLRLQVWPKKTVWRYKETLEVLCRIQNVSEETVLFAPVLPPSPMGTPGAEMPIVLRDRRGKAAELHDGRGLFQADGLNVPDLDEKDVVRLKPSDCWEYVLQREVIWAPGEYEAAIQYYFRREGPAGVWKEPLESNTFRVKIVD